MTVTQASLNALAAHTRTRSDTVRARIEKALRDLRKQNADITISSVARRAGVTSKSIYPREDLLDLIHAPRPAARPCCPPSPPPARSWPFPTTHHRSEPKPASSPRCGPG